MKLPFDMRKIFRAKASSKYNSSSRVSFETLVNFMRAASDCLKVILFGSIKGSERKSGSTAFTKTKQTVCNTFGKLVMKPSDEKVKDHKSLSLLCSKTNHDRNDC